jgi:hypothetical protein
MTHLQMAAHVDWNIVLSASDATVSFKALKRHAIGLPFIGLVSSVRLGPKAALIDQVSAALGGA